MYRIILTTLLSLLSVGVYGQVSTKIQIGSARTIADVEATVDPLNAAQISVQYAHSEHLILYGGIGFMSVSGTDLAVWQTSAAGGGLVESYYMPDSAFSWIPSFTSKLLTLNSGIVYKYNLIKNKLSVVIGGGIGIANASSYIDLKDQNNLHYSIHPESMPSLAQLDQFYDGVFETRIDDLNSWLFNLQLTAGIEFSLNESLSLCADYTRYILTTDYIDGVKYLTPTEETGGNDGLHFLSLGLKMKMLAFQVEDRKAR